MQAISHGFAILIVRATFILFSYFVMQKVDWRKFFSARNYYMARPLMFLSVLSVGHLSGSFFVTMIELLQQLVFSILTKE